MGTVPRSFSPDLFVAATRAAEAATREGHRRWLLIRFPIAADTVVPLAGSERFSFEEPARGFAIQTEGVAAEIEATGPDRFELLARAARETAESLCVLDPLGDAAPRPTWVGGFAFADAEPDARDWPGFPAARFVIPRRLRARYADGRAFEHRASAVEPGEGAGALIARLLRPTRTAHPEIPATGIRPVAEEAGEAAYLERVQRAVAAVRSGLLEKVVVARSQTCRAPKRLAPDAVLAALRERHPECRIFGLVRPTAAFVGASPERLVETTRGRVHADALAGTAPRGRTPGEDAALARTLRESKKEQEEHAVVVRALQRALEPLCRELAIDEAPKVKQLASIQHLHTRAVGCLHRGLAIPLLALASRLHPTPAVCGAPDATALAWLTAHEGLTRGWYAGCVGWMDLLGDGDLAVALRSALLRGSEGRLFAGAGIVASSDPLAELSETRLKLEAARRALGAPA